MTPGRRARVLIALVALAALAACGQKGPLTLPEGAAPPAQTPQPGPRAPSEEDDERA